MDAETSDGSEGGSGSALLLSVGLLATTLGAFATASVKTPHAVQVYLHPFLQCSAATLLACAGVGALSGLGWRSVLASYASPGGAGGGDGGSGGVMGGGLLGGAEGGIDGGYGGEVM